MSDPRYLRCAGTVGFNHDKAADAAKAIQKVADQAPKTYIVERVWHVGDTVYVRASYDAVGSNIHQIRRLAADLARIARVGPVNLPAVVPSGDTTIVPVDRPDESGAA